MHKKIFKIASGSNLVLIGMNMFPNQSINLLNCDEIKQNINTSAFAQTHASVDASTHWCLNPDLNKQFTIVKIKNDDGLSYKYILKKKNPLADESVAIKAKINLIKHELDIIELQLYELSDSELSECDNQTEKIELLEKELSLINQVIDLNDDIFKTEPGSKLFLFDMNAFMNQMENLSNQDEVKQNINTHTCTCRHRCRCRCACTHTCKHPRQFSFRR